MFRHFIDDMLHIMPSMRRYYVASYRTAFFSSPLLIVFSQEMMFAVSKCMSSQISVASETHE